MCVQPARRSAKLALEAVGEFWHCVLDFDQPRFLQEVSGVREMWVEVSFPYHRDLWVWKATSSICSLLSEDKDRGLRNSAVPFLFLLCPNHGHLLPRGFPGCLVLWDS